MLDDKDLWIHIYPQRDIKKSSTAEYPDYHIGEQPNEPFYDARTDLEVMQDTGLKDKNGKEIFENDILEHPEYGNCKVIYRYGGFGIEAKTSSWINTGFHSFSTRSADYEHCEVLGNLYENSNLLSQDE